MFFSPNPSPIRRAAVDVDGSVVAETDQVVSLVNGYHHTSCKIAATDIGYILRGNRVARYQFGKATQNSKLRNKG